MTTNDAYKVISKHVFLAIPSAYRDVFDPDVILADTKEDAFYIAKEHYGVSSPVIYALGATNNTQVFEVKGG